MSKRVTLGERLELSEAENARLAEANVRQQEQMRYMIEFLREFASRAHFVIKLYEKGKEEEGL